MREPTAIQYVFGNPVVATLLPLGALYLFYLACFERGSIWLAFGGLAVGAYCGTAYQRVDAYHRWKRDWNAMGASRAAGSGSGNIPGARYIVGFVIWALCAWGVVRISDQPGMGIPAALFWIGSVVMGASALLRRGRKVEARPSRSGPVAVCVPVRGGANPLNAAYAALPSYCRSLMIN